MDKKDISTNTQNVPHRFQRNPKSNNLLKKGVLDIKHTNTCTFRWENKNFRNVTTHSAAETIRARKIGFSR